MAGQGPTPASLGLTWRAEANTVEQFAVFDLGCPVADHEGRNPRHPHRLTHSHDRAALINPAERTRGGDPSNGRLTGLHEDIRTGQVGKATAGRKTKVRSTRLDGLAA